MLVTLLGIVVFLHPAIRVFELVSIMALQLSLESYLLLPASTLMEVRLVQPKNVHPPMLVTLLGMVMEVRAVQSSNASSPMLLTLLGMAMEVRLVQPAYLEIIECRLFAFYTVEKCIGSYMKRCGR